THGYLVISKSTGSTGSTALAGVPASPIFSVPDGVAVPVNPVNAIVPVEVERITIRNAKNASVEQVRGS
ncbi:MAG: hypothetical protein V4671_08115, partial [Armatimonadota bacterium]